MMITVTLCGTVYRQTAKLSNEDHLAHHNFRSKHAKYFNKTMQMQVYKANTHGTSTRVDTMHSSRSR